MKSLLHTLIALLALAPVIPTYATEVVAATIVQKKLQCPEPGCGKKFDRSSSLIRHMRTHTGEKLFKCTTCNKSFNENRSLKIHMSIHTGEKPYACEHCNKSFNEKGKLKRHTRIHTADSRYTCALCNRSLVDGYGLKRHMKLHTTSASTPTSQLSPVPVESTHAAPPPLPDALIYKPQEEASLPSFIAEICSREE